MKSPKKTQSSRLVCNSNLYQRMNKTPSLDKASAGLLTIGEAATLLRVHEKTLYRWISERRVRAVRIGRLLRLPASTVEALLWQGHTE